MTSGVVDAEKLRSELAGKNPRTILKTALSWYDRIAISFSGAEDVVLIDMACKIQSGVQVFTLDTGRLHPETYRFLEVVRERYPIRLTVLFPDYAALERMIAAKGMFSFFREGHEECCGIRKIEPLRRQLKALDAWISGQRRDQGPTRQNLTEVEIDDTFFGVERPLIKFNPLAHWSSAQVWDYIEAHDVPYNELHRHGYASIGCEPCTRPILPHQQEREGRWWWEDSSKKECGLHAGNLNRTK